jgi:glucokinase
MLNHHIDALTLAELAQGIMSDWDQFLYFDVGYGVGVRAVQAGQPVHGMFGNAGLLGHTTVVPGGRHCLCGNDGCLEEYVSARTLVRRCPQLSMSAASDMFPDWDDLATIATHLFSEARRGNQDAQEFVDELEMFLAIGLANTINIFDIPYVVISGFIAQGGDMFRQRLTQATSKRLQPTLGNEVKIIFSNASRSSAAAHGAALYTLKRQLPFVDPLAVIRTDLSGGEPEKLTFATTR